MGGRNVRFWLTPCAGAVTTFVYRLAPLRRIRWDRADQPTNMADVPWLKPQKRVGERLQRQPSGGILPSVTSHNV